MIKTIKYTLLVVLILEIIYLAFSYGKESYDFYSKKNEIEKINTLLEKETSILNNMKSESIMPSKTDKETIEKDFLYKELIGGIKINKVETIEKISKKGVQETFFTVKLYFNNEDKELIKKLAILLFLNPDVFKLSDINTKYIEIILEKTYG